MFLSHYSIAAVKSPVIIMHAEDDLVIPYDLGLKVKNGFVNLITKLLCVLKKCKWKMDIERIKRKKTPKNLKNWKQQKIFLFFFFFYSPPPPQKKRDKNDVSLAKMN